ncbi:MAG: GHMP kinase [Acidobacteria bacterium]|nr:GHMP kinase [Acidobacteriota bacterium]
MFQIIRQASQQSSDTAEFIRLLESETDFLVPEDEIFVARAPGRLDVMGGIADYCGSLVLEMPTAEATFAALRKIDEPVLRIVSGEAETRRYEMPLDVFSKNGAPVGYAAARDFFRQNPDDHWAAYVAGVFLVLMREKGVRFDRGAQLFISSNVPQGKGVSSSAALEAAAMTAVCAGFGIALEPRETALLCQRVENLVVGAPCGVMDQMTVVCGAENQLMAMVCQPAELGEPVNIPAEIGFWGIDSGIRHSVGGADYGSVRTGAFMGYRMIVELAGLKVSNENGLRIDGDRWRGYPANITPAGFEANFRDKIPLEMTGAEFLAKYGGITDTVTRVDPERTYAVLHPLAHPIYEHARVRRFAELLGGEIDERILIELGDLMGGSHRSYSACGLGSDGTDLLVELVEKTGGGLYGAKITGGGSGGTVAVIGRAGAEAAIARVAAEYRRQTGHDPYIFRGSSPGAARFGHLVIRAET